MNFVSLCLMLLLALTTRQTDATCRGHDCDEDHAHATAAGLLGGSLGATDVWTPKQCRDSVYPKKGRLALTQELPTPVVNVKWAPNKGPDVDKFVFALTRASDGEAGGHLFRSDYYGKEKSWDDRTNEMTDVLDQEDKKAALVGVVDIHFLDEHSGHMLFQGPGHKHWTSEDYGETYKAVDTPGGTMGYASEIKIHPTHPDWVLARVRRNECMQEVTAVSKWCAYDLFLSQDFAQTWTNLTEGSGGRIASFWDFEWLAALDRQRDDPFPDATILATVYESTASLKGPYPGWDKDMHFVVSKDFFKSKHQSLVPCGNQFEVISNQIFLATASDCPLNPDGSKRQGTSGKGGRARDVTLLVSNDEARTFTEACLPIKWLDQGYNLVTTHDGKGAFVIVDHDEQDELSARAPISNIYSSGPNSTIYTIGMRRNYRRRFITDFARVEGLPGMYMANQLDGRIFDDPSLMPSRTSYDEFVQTKVSLNGAATWQVLTPPEKFNFPECTSCRAKDTCKLHLHGPSSWHYGADARPSFYSHKSAPGVIMAVGNTGEYLDMAADTTCTFLSTDGGMTWTDVLPQAAIYEVGDWGGIIILTSHMTTGPAEEVYFSLDSGGCWYTVQLEEAINVQNIRVEPKGASDTFIVHGQACVRSDAHPSCTHDPTSGNPPSGKIYTIDISDVMGADLRECKTGDYEVWSPPDGKSCLLGRNYTMKRRKTDADCFNSYDFQSETKSEACPCGESDTECEFGYEFVGHECKKIPEYEINTCSLVKAKQYFESETHRRLVHEDTCADVSRVIPDTNGQGIPNGGLPSSGGHSGVFHFFVFLLVAGVVSLAIGIWWSQFAAPETKAAIEEVIFPVLEAVVGIISGAWHWFFEKLPGSHSRPQAHDYFQPLSEGPLDDFPDADARSPSMFPSSFR